MNLEVPCSVSRYQRQRQSHEFASDGSLRSRVVRTSLDAIIDLNHPLVGPAQEIDCKFLWACFGCVCSEGSGQPPPPTRLVIDLLIL